MAKSVSDSRKVTFGKRKHGKARKSSGPKDKHKSVYKAQGKKH
jgi:hypothetical protein